jgi:ATP-binding cassette subfamily F protein 3
MKETISIKNVRFGYDDHEMFSGISATISSGDRVLVVGENGAGKSTFMRLCLGELAVDAGTVTRPRSLCVYVPQEFSGNKQTLTEYFGELHPKHLSKAKELALFLGFPKKLMAHDDLELSGLSGGQQKILSLARAIAPSPSFLFLDEPENHLDIVSRARLIELLYEFRGALVMVSHDRTTVDTLASSIFEIDKGHLYVTEGGYEEYLEARASRIENAQVAFDNREKRIKQMEKSVRILGKIAFRGKGVANYQNRKAELEQLKQESKSETRASDSKTKIGLAVKSEHKHSGKRIATITNLNCGYYPTEKPIVVTKGLEIFSGETIVLLGRNGSGKSTILKTLMNELTPIAGEVKWGNDITYAYFNQHAEFDPTHTPLQIAQDVLGYRDDEARRVLGMVKFNGQLMITKVGELSGGQRMRLRFALTFSQRPDFLILDEPTNHIDETTWEILLSVCKEFSGTLLVVSHDYAFIKELDPKYYWVIKQGKLEERYKDIDELLEELAE